MRTPHPAPRTRRLKAELVMPPLLLALLQAAAMAQAPDTLATNADVQIKASGGATNFASAICSLGDINNDGFDDLLVANVSSNAVKVYFGPLGSTNPSFTFSFGTRFGASIAGNGDFDGDNVRDIMIGAPDTDFGSGFQTGVVYVFSGATGAEITHWPGTTSFTHMGEYVTFTANIDGIQGDEALVLADILDPTMPVSKARSISQPPLFLFQMVGQAPSNAGQVDDDPFMIPDVATGLPLTDHGADVNAGHIKYYRGDTGSLLTLDDQIGPFGAAGEQLGGIVRFMGDVNNDQRGDIIASGAPFDNNRGRIRIVSGLSPLHDPVWVIDGAAQGDQFGSSVANIGDYNGDGVDDFVVGAPFNDPVLFGQTFVDAGRTYLYSGATGVLLRTFTGVEADGHFGAAVSGAKDYNGDGVLDLAISAPGDTSPTNGTGVVYVFYLPCTFFGDLNDDSVVDGADLAALLVQFNQTCALPPTPSCPADFNNDTVVDGKDLAILLVNWGTGTCTPPGAPAMAGEPGGGGMGSQSTMDPSGAPSQQSQSQSGQAYMLSVIAQFGFSDLASYYTWLEMASGQELAAHISALIDAIARNEQ